MRILITGGNGYVGKALTTYFNSNHEVTAITRQAVDLTDSCAVSEWFKDKYFDVVLHTAIVGGNRLVPDGMKVIHDNLAMHLNIMNCKSNFGKYISFGSGAEIYFKDTIYGKSKALIAEDIVKTDNCYNIRIFAIFDQNELDRRFIKSNINRVLDGEDMVVHADKGMDFFYMPDLCRLVDYYIKTDNPPKETDAVYKTKYLLSEIAEMINDLSSTKVKIKFETNVLDKHYIGCPNLSIAKYMGLQEGIRHTFMKIAQSGIVAVRPIV